MLLQRSCWSQLSQESGNARLDADEAAEGLEALPERSAGAVEHAGEPRRALLCPRILALRQLRSMHLGHTGCMLLGDTSRTTCQHSHAAPMHRAPTQK